MSGLPTDQTQAAQLIQEHFAVETTSAANLLLDAEMIGGPLQGRHFLHIVPKLSAFARKVAGQEIKAAHVQAVLSALPAEFVQSKERKAGSCNATILAEDMEFVTVIAFLLAKVKGFEQLTQYAGLVFDRLIRNGDVIFPGGFVQGAGGHAMLYRLMIDWENKAVLFLVLQAGNGLQYHENSVNPQLTKILYENAVSYRIPFAKIKFPGIEALTSSATEQKDAKADFIAFITKLLRPLVQDPGLREQDRDACYLYEVLFEEIRMLGGSPVKHQS